MRSFGRFSRAFRRWRTLLPMSSTVWLAIFMLLVLKIPLVYLALVIWWAVRAEPVAPGGSGADAAPIPVLPLTPCGWDDWKRTRRAMLRRPPPRPIRPPARRAYAEVE